MSKLLFVLHETPDGRPSRAKKAMIHAHTLQHNRKKRFLPPRSSVESHISDELADRTISSETQLGSVDTEENVEPDGRSILSVNGESHAVSPWRHHSTISPPLGTTLLGRYGEDVQSIGQWYFHSQLDGVRSFEFYHAQTHWANALWDMARANQPMFAAIGAFALHKEVTLAKRSSNSAYLEQKGRTLWHISQDLRQPHCALDPLTMVAIALLAFMDVRDGNLAAAKTHLEAVRDLVGVSRMSTHAWSHCVWTDLRYALFTGLAPIIPHWIPPSLRRDTSTRSSQHVRMVSQNVANCPQAAFFTHDIAFGIFDKLHGLCHHPTQLGVSEVPPFGQVYDLEYSLRMIQSQVSKNEQRERSSQAVELVLLTVQLHLWMVCRFWTPQRRESHLAVVSRACSILYDFEDIAIRWLDFGSARSLLWVLFTMTATVQIHARSHQEHLLALLSPILDLLDIGCQDDFSKELTTWPWIDDWHPVHIQRVWSSLFDKKGVLEAQRPDSDSNATPAASTRSQERLFLGGVEFYNGP